MLFFSDADQFGGGIAHGQLHVARETGRAQRVAGVLQVRAIALDFVRLAKIQVLEVSRRESVSDVHEQQRGARDAREPLDVAENRGVGAGMLDGDEDVAVHFSL